jgi:hypothetical protein
MHSTDRIILGAGFGVINFCFAAQGGPRTWLRSDSNSFDFALSNAIVGPIVKRLQKLAVFGKF